LSLLLLQKARTGKRDSAPTEESVGFDTFTDICIGPCDLLHGGSKHSREETIPSSPSNSPCHATYEAASQLLPGETSYPEAWY
jgi:hypothetical protein